MKSDVQQHGPFFSLCQAVFYVFAFRHKELLESHRGKCSSSMTRWMPNVCLVMDSFLLFSVGLDFLRRLNFERIITSRLNPLKVRQHIYSGGDVGWLCLIS